MSTPKARIWKQDGRWHLQAPSLTLGQLTIESGSPHPLIKIGNQAAYIAQQEHQNTVEDQEAAA